MSGKSPQQYAQPLPSPTVTPISRPITTLLGHPTDIVATRQAVIDLVELYFAWKAPIFPILDDTTFRSQLQNNRDSQDESFFQLLLNVCAATASAVHSEPLPASLSSHFMSWREVGKAFQGALPGRRMRELVCEGGVSPFQVRCTTTAVFLRTDPMTILADLAYCCF